MRYLKWGKRGYKLVCYSRLVSKPYLIKDPDCDNESIWAYEVEQAVISDLFSFTAREIEPTSGISREILTPLQILERSKQELETKLRRLYGLYAKDGNDILLEAIEELRGELAELETKITRELESSRETRSLKLAREKLNSVASTWQYMGDREKRVLLSSVISGITVTHYNVRIEYKL
jgi:site-specific DNA recombinase